ncbi:MAG: hypothetical protein QG597_3985, partial [Actinomycetota bacterium]|nr:hypothetical protein [Actinomycetota bacterium]
MPNTSETFVNPYTFIPFSANDIRRRSPAGHSSLASGGPGDGEPGEQRYLGRLDLRVTARTRILVRGGPDGGPPVRGGVPIIPGSSLHGALRSMHEVLCGGCLRVFDADFVPSYRDEPESVRNETWKLAVVDA